MPDPRQIYRRVTESTFPTRLISHITVVSLLVIASMAGLAQTHEPDGTDAGADSNFLVSAARGANDGAPTPTSASLLQHLADDGATDPALPLEGEDVVAVDRGQPATQPGDEPKPMPVALDPDATPIPGPTTATGETSGQGAATGAPSTRAAAPAAPTALFWPVPGGSVSQYFHAGHLAVDIAAPYGTQVVAAQAGTVTSAGWRNNGGGYVVSINHGNGIQTTYNHLGAVWVSPGQYVSAGQGIAPVGCTGICTGPHVHFEVVTNGVIDNPMRYF